MLPRAGPDALGPHAFAHAVPSAWLPVPPSSTRGLVSSATGQPSLPGELLIPDSGGPGCFPEAKRGGQAGCSAWRAGPPLFCQVTAPRGRDPLLLSPWPSTQLLAPSQGLSNGRISCIYQGRGTRCRAQCVTWGPSSEDTAVRGMHGPEGSRALALPDKLATGTSPTETFFGRGRLPPRAPGILRFCSTLGVSVFCHLIAATARQGLQHELGVQCAAVCGVGTGRRGWCQPWVRGGRKGGAKAVDSAQLPSQPAPWETLTPLHGGDGDGCSSSCSENQVDRCRRPSGAVPGHRALVESHACHVGAEDALRSGSPTCRLTWGQDTSPPAHDHQSLMQRRTHWLRWPRET